jgi:hypothetical protein
MESGDVCSLKPHVFIRVPGRKFWKLKSQKRQFFLRTLKSLSDSVSCVRWNYLHPPNIWGSKRTIEPSSTWPGDRETDWTASPHARHLSTQWKRTKLDRRIFRAWSSMARNSPEHVNSTHNKLIGIQWPGIAFQCRISCFPTAFSKTMFWDIRHTL